LVFLV